MRLQHTICLNMVPKSVYQFFILFVTLVIFSGSLTAAKKLKEANAENCEVCVKFVQRFIDSLDSDTSSTPEKVEKAFRKLCKTAKKDDNRFCYYVGGTEDSATSIIGELTKPISWKMPAEKICLKLYKKDEQICDLRYEKTIDLSNVDLNKLKVKDLKKILADWDEQCKGCTEKTDFVKRIQELIPIHAPEAMKKSEL